MIALALSLFALLTSLVCAANQIYARRLAKLKTVEFSEPCPRKSEPANARERFDVGDYFRCPDLPAFGEYAGKVLRADKISIGGNPCILGDSKWSTMEFCGVTKITEEEARRTLKNI